MRKSSMQWSFSNSQFLSFKSGQEQGGTHHHNQYPPPGFSSQRKLGLDTQGGSQYAIHNHPWQSKDAINKSPESRIVPATVGLASTVAPAVCAAAAVSVTPPHGPVVGSTDLKSSPSMSTGPCQLTLFYNGSVCVYDNVSPDKAQAIMLLAGNGETKKTSATALGGVPKVQVQPTTTTTTLRPTGKDECGVVVGLSSSSPVSMASPVSVTNNTINNNSSSPRVVTSTSAIATLTTFAVTTNNNNNNSAQIKCPEPLKTASTTTPSAAAMPQARKASLARFLEKRKERVTATAPYTTSKKGSEYNIVESTTLARIPSSSSLPTT